MIILSMEKGFETAYMKWIRWAPLAPSRLPPAVFVFVFVRLQEKNRDDDDDHLRAWWMGSALPSCVVSQAMSVPKDFLLAR